MLTKRIEAGEVIFSEGDGADVAYLIEDGAVEITAIQGNQSQILARLGPGQIFGELGVIDAQPRSGTATATRPTLLLVVTADQIQQAIARADPFFAELMLKLVGRLRHTQAALLLGDAEMELQTSEIGPGYAELVRERDIAEAIISGQIEPYLQPIVDLRTGTIKGYETLARWRSDRFGLMRPFDFLPLARRTGLIRRIDLTMADRAMALCAEMQDHDRAPFVSINISAWHFQDRTLTDTLKRIIAERGVAPSRLCIEVTETLLLEDMEGAEDMMEELRDAGIHMALDDFGTGFSSLSILHRLPFDQIKVDGSLIQGAGSSPRQQALLQGILDLCSRLGIEVVAEGIEDEETRQTLLALGFTLGQGLHFAAPIEAERAVESWRAERSAIA